MDDEVPASLTMVRALNKLKTALGRVGLVARVGSTGTSRIVLHVDAPNIDITCRTKPSEGHRWWFWLGDEPIGPADEPTAAVQAIKRKHASETAS